MLERIIGFSVRRPGLTVFLWVLLIAAATPLTLKVVSVAQGSSDPVYTSESNLAGLDIERHFGPGSLHVFPVVAECADCTVRDPRFAAAVAQFEKMVAAKPGVAGLRHFWNSGAAELLGRDGRTALIFIGVAAGSFSEAEGFVEPLRSASSDAAAPKGFSFRMTGMTAALHDFNRESSSDLLKAERVGLPLVLLILLLVFGAPLAAALPLVLALASVALAQAVLYACSGQVPVSVFALNVVSMIGLGVGVDYCLFVLSRYRSALQAGADRRAAALAGGRLAGHTVLFSGVTVALGFMALLLVKAKFLRSLTLGGTCASLVAVAASLTLLPALLSLLPESWVNWPRNLGLGSGLRSRLQAFWGNFARRVMAKPWRYMGAALLILLALAAPAGRLKAWNMGAQDLPPHNEVRLAELSLEKNFERGWSGPLLLLIESQETHSVWEPEAQELALRAASYLKSDKRVALVTGYAQLLGSLGPLLAGLQQGKIPPQLLAAARGAVSAEGRAAMIIIVPHEPAEAPSTLQLVRDLRIWLKANQAGTLAARVSGPAAYLVDFDHEFFSGLWKVVPTVLGLTFVVLMLLFRSVLIPLKATAMNLLAVMASYGFLVYLFQYGIGAGLIGLKAPGGLNSFIVLMLFTILFGLSMDYEVFLLSRIREEVRAGRENNEAVVAGLEGTGGLISSAALIMVCLFASFGFQGLTATREFGLGLAFAVALDATLVRLVLVPALMQLLGGANWWLPRPLQRIFPEL